MVLLSWKEARNKILIWQHILWQSKDSFGKQILLICWISLYFQKNSLSRGTSQSKFSNLPPMVFSSGPKESRSYGIRDLFSKCLDYKNTCYSDITIFRVLLFRHPSIKSLPTNPNTNISEIVWEKGFFLISEERIFKVPQLWIQMNGSLFKSVFLWNLNVFFVWIKKLICSKEKKKYTFYIFF